MEEEPRCFACGKIVPRMYAAVEEALLGEELWHHTYCEKDLTPKQQGGVRLLMEMVKVIKESMSKWK